VEPERARELLAQERARLESALQLHAAPAAQDGGSARSGDPDGADLEQDELDGGRRHDLELQLAAVQRAEERLRNGTYGLSVQSGTPIPDARLEARPTAELTVEEQQGASR
jgi:RNA polymerase-binding transcription factor